MIGGIVLQIPIFDRHLQTVAKDTGDIVNIPSVNAVKPIDELLTVGAFDRGHAYTPQSGDDVQSAHRFITGIGARFNKVFLVWQEMITQRSWKKFSVYTKLVLSTTVILLLAGWLVFCVLEWNNPATIGEMNIADKLLNGLFQSVTVRTAGFASVDQAYLTDASKAVAMVLMLIGGSSGSTAGGVKTVTMVVLILFLATRARGRSTVCVFKRTVPNSQVLDAMTIVSLVVGLAVFGAVFISATSPISFVDAAFEAVSALATVGITAGATTALCIPAQFLIILYMYFGRVGVLTISLGFLMGDKAEERFEYARTNLLIG